MKILHSQKINKEIKEDYVYSFETSEGIYLIEVVAKAKSWWQNFKRLKSFLKDDDIILSLDDIEIFTSNSEDNDVKAIWNGNQLKGLSKMVLVAIILKNGWHAIRLKSNQSPSLESIKVMELEEMDNHVIVYSPLNNNPPEEGDRRPWIDFVLQNLAIKEINISANANKRGRDDEDIKLVIDGKVEENGNESAHKDWYWCGKILKGNELMFRKEVNFSKGKHFIELWSDRSPRLNKIEVSVLSDGGGSEYNKKAIRPYKYKGIFGNEDYNRYDTIISEVVAFWNSEFLKDTDPPPEPLDPNLVKAIMYQESRIGFDKTAGVNLMQVGKVGDPSLSALRGEHPEYWIHNGQLILLSYDAKVESIKDSIYWGVRWLYHKAQGSTIKDRKRYWISWREAVIKYGPPKEEYADSVWNIYEEGVKKDKKIGIIRLWSIILIIMLMPLFSDSSAANSLENTIKNQILKGESQYLEDDIEFTYSRDKKYFFAQVEWEKDWWEELKVGRIKNNNVEWLKIDRAPSEQAILSGRFINLSDDNCPMLEIYGLTHAGHGFLYIYEIQNDNLKLLLKTAAVDDNPDTRWAPGNDEKYGYRECGEIFSNGKLASAYRDINKDGHTDLILSGIQKIICEEMDENYQRISEAKADSIRIERKFLWNEKEHTWIDTANRMPEK